MRNKLNLNIKTIVTQTNIIKEEGKQTLNRALIIGWYKDMIKKCKGALKRKRKWQNES